MRPQPYIGVTGFMGQADVREILFVYPKDARHKLMVGVLMSNKTLAGEKNKYPRRYPEKDAVADIFVDHPQALNLIHYHTSNSNHAMVMEMVNVMALAGPHCHGFQLNVRWPYPKAIEDYHRDRRFGIFGHKDDIIVLQCGRGAMEEVGNSPKKLAERVKDYDGLVSYVLIDPSGGKGEAFDSGFAYDCLCELTRAVPNMGIGVAGGLSAQSINNICNLLTTHPDISVDAEGRLRDTNDDLNITATVEYVVAANRLFRQHPIAA
jgi:hypothetical protein